MRDVFKSERHFGLSAASESEAQALEIARVAAMLRPPRTRPVRPVWYMRLFYFIWRQL